jgi:hypothetical protein
MLRRFDAAEPADGLDHEVWRILSTFVGAAARGDVTAARDAIPHMERGLPNDGQAGAYVWYLLRYRVVEILARRPSAEDLHDLAVTAWPRFAELVNADEHVLEDIFRSVFKFETAGEVTGAKLIVLGSAALGVLLDDPDAGLEVIRPHLVDWWRKNRRNFEEQGIIAPGA